MIVVTGASGQLGRQVIEGLLRTMPAADLGVSVREPERVADLRERGVRVRRGDFAEPASLPAAFDGAEQVLLVSVNRLGEEVVRQHGAAIRAAKAAGVKRVLYTSHQAASAGSAFAPARDHAATEELLRGSGLGFVSLRNGFYAESALFQMGGVRTGNKLALPADGPVSWTARADLAAVAVAALTEPGLLDGISPALTGAEAVDFAGLAGICAEVLGRAVDREVVTDETYRAGLVARGLPQTMAEAIGSLYLASRAGEFAVVDPTLERVLGRRPVAVTEVVRAFLERPVTGA